MPASLTADIDLFDGEHDLRLIHSGIAHSVRN
jgi:hypothetical protein